MTTLEEIEESKPYYISDWQRQRSLLIRAVRQLDKLAQFHAFHEMKEWLDPDVLALLEEGR